MRVAAICVLAAALLTPGLAAAAEPSVISTDGASAWSYRDAYDLSPKREGGYLQYNGSSSFYSSDGAAYDTPGGWVDQSAFLGKGPHGGYDTSTNKCKACHAVHRAEGGTYLLRANSVDDACDYCHVGGSAHSATVVYDSSADGKYTGNGHTIGASPFIPASTVSMETSIAVVERDGIEGPTDGDLRVPIRLVQPTQKKLYRIVGLGRDPESRPSLGYQDPKGPLFAAIGPTPLSCSSCHQVHNSRQLTWTPKAFSELDPVGEDGFITGGYKLLRRFPGASAAVPETHLESGEPLGTTVLAKVPESRLATGFNYSETVSLETTYTEAGLDWRQPDWVVVGGFPGGAQGAATVVNQFTLSVWCADCHNLAIGGSVIGTGYPEPGFTGIHGKGTHPVPGSAAYGGTTGGFQCYSCHRGDLDYGSSCSACHYTAAGYRARVETVGTDFPHSASEDGYKLLGNYSWAANESDPTSSGAYVATPIGPDNLSAVCLRCHNFAEGEHPSGTGDAHSVPQTYADCIVCHTAADAAALHSATQQGCQTCHSAPMPTVDCAACHQPQLQPHGALPEDHTVGAPCAASDCHDTDVTVTHAEQGCLVCHGVGITPSLVCSDCHTTVHETAHRVSTVGCDACHSIENIDTIHGDDCSTCHPVPQSTLGTWNLTCEQSGCHARPFHPDPSQQYWGHAYHNTGQNCWPCHDMDLELAPCADCHGPVYDRVPPVSTSDVRDTYAGTAVIRLTATDPDLGTDTDPYDWTGNWGVKTTYYQVDGGPLQQGTTITVEGPAIGSKTHTIEFWSLDNRGNTERPHNKATFTITEPDRIPPVTTASYESTYTGPATISLTAMDTGGSGVAATYYRLDGGAQGTGTSVLVPAPPIGSVSHTLEYWSEDHGGNIETPPKTATFTVKALPDTTAPTGSIGIDGGAETTDSLDVVLTLSATDVGSGVAEMRLSDDGITWTGWEAYAATRNWVLPEGDGEKTVHVQFRDLAGNVSESFTDTIELATGAVTTTTSVSWDYTNFAWVDADINASGPWATWSVYVNGTLVDTFPAPPGVLGSDETFTWDFPGMDLPSGGTVTITADCGWNSYSDIYDQNTPVTYTVPLPAGTVRLEAAQWSGFGKMLTSDDADYEEYPGGLYDGVWLPYPGTIGNITYTTYSGTTDAIAPTGGVTANLGAAYTSSTSASLVLSASDIGGSGLTDMRFSNDGASWSAWEPFAATKVWTLTAGDGEKAVYVQYRDGAGNVSLSYSDSIVLDTTAPAGTVSINAGVASTESVTVSLALTASDAGAGVSGMRLSNDGATWSSWESFAATKSWTLTSGNGEKTVHVQFRDAVNNVSGAISDTITLAVPVQTLATSVSWGNTNFAWVDADTAASGPWATWSVYVNDALVQTFPAPPGVEGVDTTFSWAFPGMDLPSGGHIDIVAACGWNNYSVIFDQITPVTYTVALPAGTVRLEAATWTGFGKMLTSDDAEYADYDGGYYDGVWIAYPGTIGNIVYSKQ